MTSRLQRMVFATGRAGGLFRAARWQHRKQLLVLTYHSVVNANAATRFRYSLLYRNAVSAHHFEQQMRFLKQHYHVIGEQDLLAFLEGRALPERSVLLTFDDGLRNNFTVAWPILRQFDLPAFFFLPTAFLDDAAAGTLRLHWSEALAARLLRAPPARRGKAEALRAGRSLGLPDASPPQTYARLLARLKTLSPDRRREQLHAIQSQLGTSVDPSRFPADRDGHSILATMTWEDARRMAREGAVMGAHTVRHEILARLPDDEAAREIVASTARVAENMSAPCRWFAYPNGTAQDFACPHRRVLRQAGCKAAFTQITGFNDPAPAAPMALRRIDTSSDYDLDTFRYVTSGTKLLIDKHIRRRQ